jgi:diguanylate cyclase
MIDVERLLSGPQHQSGYRPMTFKLFYNLTDEDLSAEQWVEKTTLLQEKSDVFFRSVEALLHFLKSFAMDLSEIRSERFKERIDALSQLFASSERPKRIELDFERQKENILGFIERQHGYIADREQELRDIIDLLTKAMASLDVENREFYQRVHDQSEKMEQITLLDDIKKIKSALQFEVTQMRDIVDQKKDQDHRQVQLLAGQVDSLRQELEKTKAKSMTDGLTGAYNRQAFDDTLKDLIERSRVMNNDFSLLILDLDDFKKINDTHGHLMGDKVLVAFCQKCRKTIRGDDVLARYGGEEFAIILPGANLKNALKKGRQICDTISSARYATSTVDGEDYLSVTVSIGVTVFKKDDTPETLISRADKALYKAKKSGKNCAVAVKS